LSLGPDCDRYLQHVMRLVLQAGAVQVQNPDLDTMDTLEELRVAVLEICSATLQSLATANKQGAFLNYMQGIETLLKVISEDPNCMKSKGILKTTVSLIGDMIQNCPPQQKATMKQRLNNNIVVLIVRTTCSINDQDTRERGAWCQRMLS